MKHLKSINEYFDMEELSKKHGGGSNIDFKKMVGDESIIKSSLLDSIVAQIKLQVPYFKGWDTQEYENGILFTQAMDWFIDKGESVFAKLSMHIELQEQDIFERGKFEDLFYVVTYASFIILLEGDEKPLEEYVHLFEDEYEGVSNVGGGDVKVKFKSNFGMKELVKFLKTTMVPQMEKTVDEFEDITREKLGRRGNVNNPINVNK